MWALPRLGVVALYATIFCKNKRIFTTIANAKKSMNNLIITSKSLAIISLIVGTVLFSLQLYLGKETSLISIGFIFVVIAVIINSISLLIMVFYLLGNSKQKIEVFKTIGIILLNIPIAVLYFYIIISTQF